MEKAQEGCNWFVSVRVPALTSLSPAHVDLGPSILIFPHAAIIAHTRPLVL